MDRNELRFFLKSQTLRILYTSIVIRTLLLIDTVKIKIYKELNIGLV